MQVQTGKPFGKLGGKLTGKLGGKLGGKSGGKLGEKLAGWLLLPFAWLQPVSLQIPQQPPANPVSLKEKPYRTFVRKSFLARKVDSFLYREQREELNRFVWQLKSASRYEVGRLVAYATDIRHQMEAQGHRLLEPGIYAAAHPAFTAQLRKKKRQLEKSGQREFAAGMSVWEQTFLATTTPALKPLGLIMWQELERGFPYVAQNAIEVALLSLIELEVSGADSIPEGFLPS